jgi:hypothetical protein
MVARVIKNALGTQLRGLLRQACTGVEFRNQVNTEGIPGDVTLKEVAASYLNLVFGNSPQSAK